MDARSLDLAHVLGKTVHWAPGMRFCFCHVSHGLLKAGMPTMSDRVRAAR